MGVRLEEVEPSFARDIIAPHLKGVAEESPIIARVQRLRQPDLPEVAEALCRFRALLRPGQRRQQHRGQNSDDRDDHKKLDEGEGIGDFRFPISDFQSKEFWAIVSGRIEVTRRIRRKWLGMRL